MKKCGSIDPQRISVKNKETVLSHLKFESESTGVLKICSLGSVQIRIEFSS